MVVIRPMSVGVAQLLKHYAARLHIINPVLEQAVLAGAGIEAVRVLYRHGRRRTSSLLTARFFGMFSGS